VSKSFFRPGERGLKKNNKIGFNAKAKGGREFHFENFKTYFPRSCVRFGNEKVSLSPPTRTGMTFN
jgi:hypothetical protein